MNSSDININQDNCFKTMSINTDNNAVAKVFETSSLFHVKLPFPLKLHALLNEVTNQPGHEDIISWQIHGRAFRIHNPKKFEELIMPRYFNNTKYKSFLRQLRLYDFCRLKTGVDSGAYHHLSFIRGQPSLSLGMVRRKIKGTDRVKRSNSENDMVFYAQVNKLEGKKEVKLSKVIDGSVDQSRQISSKDPIPCHPLEETNHRDLFPSCTPQDVSSIERIQCHSLVADNKRQFSLTNNETEISSETEDFIRFGRFEPLEQGQEVSFGGRKFFFVDELHIDVH